jgi:hypothetical protein
MRCIDRLNPPPGAVIGKRQLSGNQHGHLNRARLPHDGPGISTVAPVASGWQTRDDRYQILHQFNGTEIRPTGQILHAGQGLTLNFSDLIKQRSPELCGTTCSINY